MDWLDYREKLQIGFDSEEKFNYFRAKMFNVLYAVKKMAYSECIDLVEYREFCNTTGTSINYNLTASSNSRDRYQHCLNVLDRTGTLKEFMAYYMALTNSVKVEKNFDQSWTRYRFANLVSQMLEESHISFDLVEYNDGYFIFPKGAQELDDALVSEPLEWIAAYPKAHTAFVKALKDYSEVTDSTASDVADKFRKALESFFQEFFGCGKSLENYKSDYGAYLKSQGVPAEISANLESLLKAFTNYMNSYAKHHDKAGLNVLEYIMYQTGNTIRLLITLKQEETANAN